MGWNPVSRKDVNEVTTFLRSREWECTTLTEHIQAFEVCTNWLFNLTPLFIYRDQCSGQIRGALAFLQRGLVIPVWEHEISVQKSDFNTLIPIIKSYHNNIHTIIGVRSAVSYIEKLIDYRPTIVDYYLMRKKNPLTDNNSVSSFPDMKIKRADIQDAEKLFPLQVAYEKEEVLIDLSRFNPKSTMQILKKALKEHLILYAEVQGKPIAKAGTNARGFDYDQLGGIYTHTSYRNRGIGTWLLMILLREIEKQHKGVTLFVKKKNEPAISMYKKAGFSLENDFRITYYRN